MTDEPVEVGGPDARTSAYRVLDLFLNLRRERRRKLLLVRPFASPHYAVRACLAPPPLPSLLFWRSSSRARRAA